MSMLIVLDERTILAPCFISAKDASRARQTIFAASVREDLHSFHLVLYVIDEESLTGPDGATSFADLHDSVMADTQAISSFDALYVLRASLSSYAYDREVEDVADGWVTDYGVELEGPVAESRAWYLALAE